ncbi:MAG: hypothetical protein BroJett003_00420 [Planctomycetota bacterium]|nr:MAG: hypothetical protein BroJett003_00420 [Planctomycetota bacterium]
MNGASIAIGIVIGIGSAPVAPVIGVIILVTSVAITIVGVGSGPVARETPIPALTTTIPAIAVQAPFFVTIL